MFYSTSKIKASLIKYNVKNILRKGSWFVVAVAILFIGVDAYVKFWYYVIWAAILSIGVLKLDLASGKLAIRPAYQLIIASTLIFAAILAIDWAALGRRDFIQWSYAIFATLIFYREGFRWAWSSYYHV